MGKHERTPDSEECLDFAGRVFRASQTDEEMIALIRGMDFVNHALLGLCGGTLARLSRDIRDGHTVLPGRTRYQSIDLVNAAFTQALDDYRRLAPKLRKLDRELWWANHGPKAILLIAIMAVFAVVTVFFDDLLRVLASPSATESQLPGQAAAEDAAMVALEVMMTYVFPLILVAAFLTLTVGALAYMIRR